MKPHISLIFFRVHAGRAEEFLQAFQECGMLTRPEAVEGFISADLVRQHDDPDQFAVVARWESREAYAVWQAVAQRDAPKESLLRLGQCVSETTPGQLYFPSKSTGNGSSAA